MARSPDLSRRALLKGAAGLIIGVHLPLGRARAGAPAATVPFNAFVRVGLDDAVTVIAKHSELGQGVLTGLATLVAEEMDADWSQMRSETAPADVRVYANTIAGVQMTGGSNSIANSYEVMRRAGAAARAMLVEAAARAWDVPASEIRVEAGLLSHGASGRNGRFGAFAVAAAELTPPASVSLKDPAAFRLIGREGAVRRLDTADKCSGRALFTMDIHEPDLLTVMVAQPERFGGRVRAFDASAALAVSGVVAVRQISSGVAVYARGTWPAIKGRAALNIDWDESAVERRSSEAIAEDHLRLARTPGTVAASRGDVDAAFAAAETVVEAEYVFPYLAHGPMEPLDGYLAWDGRRVRARYGCQGQTLDQAQIAGIFGIAPGDVAIETMFAGGSFGRRIDLGNDIVRDMAEAAKAIGPNQPVKVVRTREDDIAGGFYRALFVHRLRGALRGGEITAWTDTIVGQSFAAGSAYARFISGGVDITSVDGSVDMPYRTANFRCDLHIAKGAVTTSSWRSVGGTHTIYAVECFVDELLERAGRDPVAGRLTLLEGAPRHAGVLRAVAKMAGWRGPEPVNGRVRGVAVARVFGTHIAEIAEVSIAASGEPVVQKVWCAVDCGLAVNPDIVRAQIEGGIGYGLGAVLFGEISLVDGWPMQRNFDSYRCLRMHEMPEVEIRILPSREPPTGVGEPGVPPIGPAVANALARLGRSRSERLPMVRTAV